MSDTPHTLLVAAGAEAFADRIGFPRCTNDDLIVTAPPAAAADTVGAVALDARGNIAAATSTGGLTGKRWGRIGDAPIAGAGTFADTRCAVSCSGTGEVFIRHGVAREVSNRMRHFGEDPATAARAVIGMLESVAIAKSIAARTGEEINPNQEFFAQGFKNLSTSFFQCIPGSGSFTRSALDYAAGAEGYTDYPTAAA